jgi:hypothetical protein
MQGVVITGLVTATAVAGLFALSAAVPQPAAAQFFNSWQGGQSRWSQPYQPNFWGFPRDRFAPRHQRITRSASQVDYSNAPAPRKPETAPTTTITVLGDSLADWLAYGLEDVLAESPEIGIIRKIKASSGLIRYDNRVDSDWAQMAREILATGKPNYVVMMIGLNDRQAMREQGAAAVAAAPPSGIRQPGEPQVIDRRDEKEQKEQQSRSPAAGPPASGERPDTSHQADPAQPQKGQPDKSVPYEFHTDRWQELYGKVLDETIAALKSKGVPVFWVALPAIRGTKATSDMSYLNSLYRAHAEKAGVVYVDLWDGFVDEDGQFAVQGPDFEGQIRRLRTPDGVYFTKSGALKLAHYVEREMRRVMQDRTIPTVLPTREVPTAQKRKPEPPSRPEEGPVVPLTTFTPGRPEELLGGGGRGGASNLDTAGMRVLVKGETGPAPTGRADDFAWPRTTSVADEIVEVLAMPVMQQPTARSATLGKHGRVVPKIAPEDAKGQIGYSGPRLRSGADRRRARRWFAR